jgi:hypothetical protein
MPISRTDFCHFAASKCQRQRYGAQEPVALVGCDVQADGGVAAEPQTGQGMRGW